MSQKGKKRGSSRSPQKAQYGFIKRWTNFLSHANPLYISFFMIWLFSAWVYGSVFYACEQNSFFAFDKILMQDILDMKGGYVLLVGRFLLLSFKYPVVGGIVFSAILTSFVHLFCYIISSKRTWLHIAPFLLVLLFLLALVLRGYNLFYQHEPSVLFTVPFFAWVLVLLIALLKRLLFQRPFPYCVAPQLKASMFPSWLGVLVFFMFGSVSVFARVKNENIRAVCSMQRLLEQEDYEGMIQKAKAVEQPNRGVAAYHAIALLQTGQLLEHLFDIPYQYPIENVKNRSNKEDDAITIYSIDGNFFAGLSMTSYHDAMERMVVDGPTIFMLKRLCRAALANNEMNLARKYLYILEQVPFETAWTSHFSRFVKEPSLIAQAPLFSQMKKLEPLQDSFEPEYRTPLFLGYNVANGNFRSAEALKASMAACLYTKMIPTLIDRANVLNERPLPVLVEQAIGLQSYADKSLIQMFALNQNFVLQEVAGFARAASPYLQNREEGAKLLKAEWLNFYPYYYYFENRPTEEAKKYHKLKHEGVN